MAVACLIKVRANSRRDEVMARLIRGMQQQQQMQAGGQPPPPGMQPPDPYGGYDPTI